MPKLSIGGLFDFFWATSAHSVKELENSVRAGALPGHVDTSNPPPELAERIRDFLGLAHIRPDDRGEGQHVFLFEARATLEEIASDIDFRVARPTTIDGFDNPRFRQRRPNSGDIVEGCGMTVNLNGGEFCIGAPELVSTEISIMKYFHCRWVGKIGTEPRGSDQAFVDFLRENRDLKLMADTLSRLC
jgi:hypothetical protein